MSAPLRLLALLLLCVPGATSGQSGDSSAALALRREYNGVAAAIDTLVRLYSKTRLERLADAEQTPGVKLPEGTRLILLVWADDEAEVFLNGAPVGSTRLTPTRIEIPTAYVQNRNVLTARCRDTDRVESGFMAGLYVEDQTGLRSVLVTTEDAGWRVASGEQAGQVAQEIFYAHTQPDIPGASVIWGPQLFGSVDIEAEFAPADVEGALRRAPVSVSLSRVVDKPMNYHESVARLVGLQERRRELATRLSAGATRMDPHLRARAGATRSTLSYTLGSAAALDDAADLDVEQALSRWTQSLPPASQQLVLHQARALRGADAATAAAPMPELTTGAAGDRSTQYVPPAELGTTGQGTGTTSAGNGGIPTRSRPAAPSTGFVLRMTGLALLLGAWAGVQSWRGWHLWHGVAWDRQETGMRK